MSRELKGTVVKKPFAVGSKSEREAIVLVTATGEYLLRRRGGNPFRDPELEMLVGKQARLRGELRDYTFFITQWEELQG